MTSEADLAWDWIWVSCEYGLLECRVRLWVCFVGDLLTLICILVYVSYSRWWVDSCAVGTWWNSGEIRLGSWAVWTWWNSGEGLDEGWGVVIWWHLCNLGFGLVWSRDFVRVEKDCENETEWRLGERWLASYSSWLEAFSVFFDHLYLGRLFSSLWFCQFSVVLWL